MRGHQSALLTHTEPKADGVSQHLISLDVTDPQVQAVRVALDHIEAALPGLISLDPADR